MKYDELLKSIKQKSYKPLYLLHGPEAYFIDVISKQIETSVLSEAERSFNQLVFYGKDADVKTIIDAACRYPMMSPYQVILLKEAQEMRSLNELTPYIKKLVPTTILVLCHKHKKFDSRSKLAKALKAAKDQVVIFESKKLYDNQVPAWITQYLKSKKLGIQTDAAALLSEYLGTDLSKISNELDKLAINLPQGTTVSQQEVQQYVGISKDYNVFELQKALGQKDALKANRIINYFIANPRKHPLGVVLGTLYNFFSKVYMLHFLRHSPDREISQALKLKSDFFLRDYKTAVRHYNLPQTQSVIHQLKVYDLRAKGVDNDSTNEAGLLQELIFKILHA